MPMELLIKVIAKALRRMNQLLARNRGKDEARRKG
jgi:hypothetical protein